MINAGLLNNFYGTYSGRIPENPGKGTASYAEKVKEKVAGSVKYILDHWKTNLPTD